MSNEITKDKLKNREVEPISYIIDLLEKIEQNTRKV